MRKPRGKGYDPIAGSATRPVDRWRQWAAVPLPTFKISSSVNVSGAPRDPVYTLEEDGVVIGTWRHADAPWLWRWITKRLPQLHGAWHLARTELGVVTKKKRGGGRTAEERRKTARQRDAKLCMEAKATLKKNPWMSKAAVARHLSDRGMGGAESIRKKLYKLL